MLPPTITDATDGERAYENQNLMSDKVRRSSSNVAGGVQAIDGVRASAQMSAYLSRIFNTKQLDWDFTFSQMVYLVVDPGQVFRMSQYRSRMKHQWARDDPAFMLLLTFFILVSSIAYGVAFSATTAWDMLILTFYGSCSLLGSGVILATICWTIANKQLLYVDALGGDNKVEWLYAFDIHCNAFFTMFLSTHVLQYLLLPLLLGQSFLSCLAANSLHAFGLICYVYITHLGYRSMSFLDRTQVFLYPIGVILLLWLLLVLFRLNMTRVVLWIYFA